MEGVVAVFLVHIVPTGRHEISGVDEGVKDGFPGAQIEVAVDVRVLCIALEMGVGKAKDSGHVFGVRGEGMGVEERQDASAKVLGLAVGRKQV